MTIIHDAILKSLEEKRARRPDRSVRETSDSGPWKLLRDLRSKNAEVENFFADETNASADSVESS